MRRLVDIMHIVANLDWRANALVCPAVAPGGGNLQFHFGAGRVSVADDKLPASDLGAFPHAAQSIVARLFARKQDVMVNAPPVIAYALSIRFAFA